MTLFISDCCDGSDEYESSIRCPNTFIMGGNLNYVYKPRTGRKSIDRQLGSSRTGLKELKTTVNLQDMVKNLQGFASFFLGMVICFYPIVVVQTKRRNVVVVFRYEACLCPPAGSDRFLGDLMDD